MPASNATFVGEIGGVRVVYKPIAGERPLWDFPDGTLAAREVASYAVSEALGWDVVPPTVLRDGPHGPGHGAAVADEPDGAGRRRPRRRGRVPTGFRHVFDGLDEPRPAGRRWSTRTPTRCGGWRSSTSWSTTPTARAGTSCPMPDGHRYGVDHGRDLPRRAQAAHRPVGLGGRAARPRSEAAGVEPVLDALRGEPRGAARGAARRRGGRGDAAPRPSACSAPGCCRAAGLVAGHPLAAASRSRVATPRIGFRGMRAGRLPTFPSCPSRAPSVRVHDTATRRARRDPPEGPARLYVCGITPYDATHIGHAATYVAFDLLNRAWRNAGHEVTYVQNVTDVDDPLLERATKVERRLGRAGRARDRALPPGHGGAAGPAARALHRGGRVHPAGRSS